ncbi:hypothetical protein GGR58DRAFT_501217 [Xylaria digitata]|nr:hypothetical protein GGR58DRAFT_501217 [Xylaria digitata]
MDALNPFKTAGWKRAARVNCAILIAFSIAMLVLTATVSSYGFQTALFSYSGSCDGGSVKNINLALQLLINVVSTLVREEVDRAHTIGSWLNIGVSSIYNVFRLSKFKSWCWVLLALSSVPFHLLFNSAVFRTEFRGADFHLTIATEDFVNGALYFAPGASLLFPGIYPPNTTKENHCYHPAEFGLPVSFSEYVDQNSSTLREISAIVTEAKQWVRLDVDDCRRVYTSCGGLTKYGNVILVVNKPGGWIRDDMWKLQDSESQFWNQYIPPTQPNNLVFDAQCSVQTSFNTNAPGDCMNDCSGALGTWSFDADPLPDWKHYKFFNGSELTTTDSEGCSLHHMASELQPSALDISIDYCLAKPLDSICQNGVSPIILLIITIFVFTKTLIALLVTTVLSHTRQAPLVTLGDAIESFIKKPDAVTIGYCAMGHEEIRKAFKSNSSPTSPEARPWQGLRKPWASAIPRSNWVMSYLLIISGIGVCVGLFIMAVLTAKFNGSSITRGGFSPSNDSPIIPVGFALLNSVMLANTPQLLLTFCYFAYNNLFTHLHLSREWVRFAYGYFPLRVTEPRGQQLSTYRLQLPYRYSLSLMIISIFLHWILANTIFVLVSTGGYYGYDRRLSDPSLPTDTAVLLGYSSTALLEFMILAIVLALIPPILGFLKRLPPNIVTPGCNSLALSAACHVSGLLYAVKKAYLPDDVALSAPSPCSFQSFGKRQYSRDVKYELLDESDRTMSFDDVELEKSDESLFDELSQSKLRWGVIRMPKEWYTQYDYDPASVKHLGFGTVEDGVAAPLWGHLYA